MRRGKHCLFISFSVVAGQDKGVDSTLSFSLWVVQ